MAGGPVSAIPNWADVDAVVERVVPADVAGHVAVRIEIRAARDVPGFRNLFADAAGTSETVLVPAEVAGPLTPGASVELRVRRGGPRRSYVHREHVRVVSR